MKSCTWVMLSSTWVGLDSESCCSATEWTPNKRPSLGNVGDINGYHVFCPVVWKESVFFNHACFFQSTPESEQHPPLQVLHMMRPKQARFTLALFRPRNAGHGGHGGAWRFGPGCLGWFRVCVAESHPLGV